MQLLKITFDDIKAAATFFAAVVAAAASLAVAYYTRKSQDKIESQKKLIQENIELLKSQLDREKNFSAFKRDRIFRHIEEVYYSYSEISSIVRKIGLRLWLSSNTDLETETKFREAYSRLRLNINALYSFQVISAEDLIKFNSLDFDLSQNWDRTLGEATLRTPEFIQDFPDHKKYNRYEYHKIWTNLMTATSNMEGFIFSLNSLVKIPT